MPTDPIPLLTDLTHELQLRLDLEELLQLVVERTNILLDTPRAGSPSAPAARWKPTAS